MVQLTSENTNAVAHRFAGDSLMYDCPDCEYGEVPLVGLVRHDSAACLDCGQRFSFHVERV
jgi:hypothetical protein